MSGRSWGGGEWVLAEDGSWRPCDRIEQLRMLQRRIHEHIVRNEQLIAANRAHCERIRWRLHVQRAWQAAECVTIN